MRSKLTGLAVTVVLTAATAWPATIIPPRDLGELAATSDAVVLARAGVARGELKAGIPFTVTDFELLEVLAGTAPAETFQVVEPGGEAGGVAASVPGAPRYELGGDYLLFLARRGDRFSSRILAWGVFERRLGDAGVMFVPVEEVRQLAAVRRAPVEPLRPLAEGELRERLAGVLRPGALADAGAVLGASQLSGAVTGDAADATAACRYLEDGDGVAARWFRFSEGGVAPVGAANPGGAADEDVARAAVAAWNAHTGSEIRLEYAGAVDVGSCQGSYSPGAILFDDPCGFLDPLRECTGVLGWGGPVHDGDVLEFNGEVWHDAHDLFVVMNEGARCIGDTEYAEVVTHELGHGLGFGHHEDPAAVMYYACCRGLGADLAATDRTCATATYPAPDAAPEPPTEVTASALSPSEVRVTWRGAGGEDGFRVERNLGAGWGGLATVAADAASFTDAAAPACASPRYRVTAVAGTGVSDASAAATATTPGDAPPEPADVVAVISPTGVEVVWRHPGTGATEVLVERARADGAFAQLALLDGAATSYRDPHGQAGDRYRVSAGNRCGSSATVEASRARSPVDRLRAAP